MNQATKLCASCAEKMSECYRLTVTDWRAPCALCGSEGHVYELEPLHRYRPHCRPEPRASYGYSAERDRRNARRRWA